MHFGGDAVHVQAVCEGLAARGHEVVVVHAVDAYTMRQPERPIPGDPPGITRIALRSGVGLLSSLLIQQTGRPMLLEPALSNVLREPFDVVHFHNVSLIGGPGVFPLSRAPVTLHTMHDHWLFCSTHVLWKNDSAPCERPACFGCAIRSGVPPQLWRRGDLVARSLEAVDTLVAPSRFVADRHRAAGVTRPMAHLPSFPAFATAATITEAPVPRFVYAGRLVKSKGVDELVATFMRHPEWELDMIGTGPLEATLRARAAASPNIRFTAMLPHESMPAMLAGATAFVLPCWGPEVFPLTVLEAMACGVPVVVRRAGGSAEAVEATGGGVVYDEPHDLAGVCRRLVADRAWRDDLAERARAGVAAQYEARHWFDGYFSLIDRVRATKPAGAHAA